MSKNLKKAEKEKLLLLMQERDERKLYNQLAQWEPYGWQEKLSNATDEANQCLAMAGNRVGKTYTGARITACHLTGIYPDWWTGHRFTKPITAWAAGASTATTRDILQRELLGDPVNINLRGSGSIPRDCVVDVVRKPQIPNAVESIVVKFHDQSGKHIGESVVSFKSYEMGEEKFMGSSLDWIWLDEQPAQNIYTQCLTRTLDKKGFVMMTFTPESGMTPVIRQFMTDRKKGQYLVQAGWDEAPHLDEDAKEQILAQYLPNEREMRTKGKPVFGRGMVFPYGVDKLVVDDFPIPTHWKRICGIDFGFDHPTAIVWGAINPENGCFYIVDEYRQSRQTATQHAIAIKARPVEPPIAWPHDGNRTFDGGDSMAQQYRQEGVNFLPEHFTNPPDISQTKGDIKIAAGITAISQAMEKNLFKVFKSCYYWQEEYGGYHFGENGKIVDKADDLMSATRYCFQSQRFAEAPKSKKGRGKPWETKESNSNYNWVT
tara:strand:+ start:448 stop:1914 length:1467 start_codon:yes stop_codon:yes gene_type:complete